MKDGPKAVTLVKTTCEQIASLSHTIFGKTSVKLRHSNPAQENPEMFEVVEQNLHLDENTRRNDAEVDQSTDPWLANNTY